MRLAAHSGCSSARMRAKSHGTDSSFVGAHNVFVTCLPNETAGPEPSFPRHCDRTTSGLRSCKSSALKVFFGAHRTTGAHRIEALRGFRRSQDSRRSQGPAVRRLLGLTGPPSLSLGDTLQFFDIMLACTRLGCCHPEFF